MSSRTVSKPFSGAATTVPIPGLAETGPFSCWLMLGTWIGTLTGLFSLGCVVVWTCIQVATAHGGLPSQYLFLGADSRLVATSSICAAVPGALLGGVMGIFSRWSEARANRTVVALLLGAAIGYVYGGMVQLAYPGLLCGVITSGMCCRLIDARRRQLRSSW